MPHRLLAEHNAQAPFTLAGVSHTQPWSNALCDEEQLHYEAAG